jgi:hypothetical protein
VHSYLVFSSNLNASEHSHIENRRNAQLVFRPSREGNVEAAYEMMAVPPEETASTTNPSPTETPSPSNGNAESKEVEHVNCDAPSAEETADAPLTSSKKATKYERMKKAFSKKKPKKKKKHKKDRLRGRKSYFWGQEESIPDPPSPSETAAEKLKQKSTRRRKRERDKKRKEKFDKEFLEASSETILSISSGDQVARVVQQMEDIVDSTSTRQTTDLGESDSGEEKDVKTSKDSVTPAQLQGSAELGDEQMEEMEADIRNNPEAVVVEESESSRLLNDAFLREKILGMPDWIFISLVVGLVLGTALGTALAVVLSR